MKRLSDQLATAHKLEAARYTRTFWALTWAGIVLAIVFVAVAFVPAETAAVALGIPTRGYTALAGLSAIAALVVALIPLIHRPQEKAARNHAAFKHYVRAKGACQDAIVLNKLGEEDYVRLRVVYQAPDDFPTIPDERFAKLKKAHVDKVAASQALDRKNGG